MHGRGPAPDAHEPQVCGLLADVHIKFSRPPTPACRHLSLNLMCGFIGAVADPLLQSPQQGMFSEVQTDLT